MTARAAARAGLVVRDVRGDADTEAFVRLPERIYRNDPHWVRPLAEIERGRFDPATSPFLHHSHMQRFLAWRDGEPVGRIAAIVNTRHLELHRDYVGFFGFFECEDDRAAASALLDAAAGWLRGQGLWRMRGPANPSQNEECGLLIDGFDGPPVVMMTYNPPYYRALFERWGLAKAMDLWAYIVDADDPPPGLVQAAEQVLADPRVRVRTIRMDDFEGEVDRLKVIYNAAWERNWGFVPMTDEEMDALAAEFKNLADPSLVLFAEVDGEVAGMALTIPDFNQALIHFHGKLGPAELVRLPGLLKQIDTARVIVLGVLKRFRPMGLGAALYWKTWEAALARGIRRAEMSWILENNEPMNRAIQMLGGRVYRTYRMYEADIARRLAPEDPQAEPLKVPPVILPWRPGKE